MIKNMIIGLLIVTTVSLIAFGYYQREKVTEAESKINEIRQKLKEQEQVAELEKKMAIRQTEKLQECEKQNQELKLKYK